MSGDGRSGLPATAVWRDTATPPSIASMRAAGMLATTWRGPRLPLMAAQPRQIGAKLREPHRGRHVQRLAGLLAHDAVDGEPVPRLETAHAGLDVGIVDVGAAGIGVEIARDGEPLAQRRSPPDGGCRAAAGRSSHLRPAALARRCSRTARSPARCAATVAGDSVGSDAFGIWMVREPESKPWPKSLPWFWSIRASSVASWPNALRGREAAAGERDRLQAAQDGRAGSDGGDQADWSLQSPKPPQLRFHAGSAFTRSQSAALGKFQHFKSA